MINRHYWKLLLVRHIKGEEATVDKQLKRNIQTATSKVSRHFEFSITQHVLTPQGLCLKEVGKYRAWDIWIPWAYIHEENKRILPFEDPQQRLKKQESIPITINKLVKHCYRALWEGSLAFNIFYPMGKKVIVKVWSRGCTYEKPNASFSSSGWRHSFQIFEGTAWIEVLLP